MNHPGGLVTGRREDPQKGEHAMLVKAKWKIKDASGWHSAGEVFNTESDLGDAVEKIEPAGKTEEKETAPVQEAEKIESPKVKPASRRRVSK